MTTVTLRRAGAADAEQIHQWRSDPGTSRYQPIMPSPLDDVRSMLSERARSSIDPSAIGKFQWVIEDRELPVGWITLEVEPKARYHGYGIVGYTIGMEHRSKGYGKAAVRSLIPIAFDRAGFNLERLEAIAAVENTASRRVLEGNGFSHDGILRGLLIINGQRVDHAIYGLLRTDWER